jgi:radical SAM superfamily enzyme YgiQ (UPF0313 family)
MAHEFIVKPPYDSFTPALKVAEGCTHDKCRFCSIYHGTPFHMLPMEEIAEQLDAIAAKCSPVEKQRIFLAGGNPFALPNRKLAAVMDEAERRVPEITSYGGLACVADIKRHSMDDLREWADRGVSMICIGAESGWDPALEFMRKGHTGKDVIEQGRRLHEAGIEFAFFYLAGMAGGGNCLENAAASGKVFSQAGPKQIVVMTLSPTAKWPLREDIRKGLWKVPDEDEMAWEVRTLVENLDCEVYVNCSHDTDIIKFTAQLPKDKENALKLLDDKIPKMNVEIARKLRTIFFKATYE